MQRKQKAQRALLSSIAEGDVVVTQGGIYGVVNEIVGSDVYLEVAEGIELKITRASIAGKVKKPVEDDGTAATAAPSTPMKGLLSKLGRGIVTPADDTITEAKSKAK